MGNTHSFTTNTLSLRDKMVREEERARIRREIEPVIAEMRWLWEHEPLALPLKVLPLADRLERALGGGDA